MSAPIGNTNGVGNSGGKTLNDRRLAAQVRTIALSKIKKLLEAEYDGLTDNDKRFHDAVLLKLAGTVLPRLNEVSGEDGEPIQFTLIKYADAPIQVPAETIPDTVPEGV